MPDNRMIKKALLIFPPGKVYIHPDGIPSARKHCSPPTGLAYLAASLIKHGYEAEVIDMTVEGYNQEIYNEPFINYGLTNLQVVERVRSSDPDIIGIGVLFSNVAQEVFELCQELKAAFPDKLIMLGGQHCTGAPIDVVSRPYVDYVLCGEADLSIVALLDSLNGDRLLESVTGLYYKVNGEVKNTMDAVKPAQVGVGWNSYRLQDSGVPLDLDELPYPAWHLFPMESYWDKAVRTGGGDARGERYAVMLSTRGCPHACYYCTSPLLSGFRGYRKRSNQSVLDEIQWLVDTYDINEIQFVEDNFFVSKPRVKVLLKLLAENFPDIVFQNTGGTEINALDEEVIDLLVEANFAQLILAIEAGDPEVQKSSIDKNVNIDRVPQIVEYLRTKDIDLRALYMFGFPGETKKQIQATMDLLLKLEILDFNLNIVTALPGTPLWDECVEKDLFLPGVTVNNLNYSRSNIKLADYTPDDLENIRRSVWREAFSKNMEKKLAAGARSSNYSFETVEDYELWGFQLRVPAREGR